MDRLEALKELSEKVEAVRSKVYCLEPKKSLITDQRYLGGKYDIAPERCCVEAVSRRDARKACKIVWGK